MDFSYQPMGWTCQQLKNNATQNLGYDVKFAGPEEPAAEEPKAPAPKRSRAKSAE